MTFIACIYYEYIHSLANDLKLQYTCLQRNCGARQCKFALRSGYTNLYYEVLVISGFSTFTTPMFVKWNLIPPWNFISQIGRELEHLRFIGHSDFLFSQLPVHTFAHFLLFFFNFVFTYYQLCALKIYSPNMICGFTIYGSFDI